MTGFVDTNMVLPNMPIAALEAMGYETTQAATLVNCVTVSTRILTPLGEVKVEELRPGDRVTTLDNGPQVVRAPRFQARGAAKMAAHRKRRPAHIQNGAPGGNVTARTLTVSPRHRILVGGAALAAHFGERGIVVPALALVGLPGITRINTPAPVRYRRLARAGDALVEV